MIDVYENDERFIKIRELPNQKSLKDFQANMEKKIENMAKILEICPSLDGKFEIAIINIKPVITKDGKETFETKMFKYDSKNPISETKNI